jgi:hypothetical protein
VERAASVRKSGVLKTVLGLVLIPVPVATFLISNSVGFFDVKIFGASVLVGAIGLWKLIDGLVMLFFPKSHQGDLSED